MNALEKLQQTLADQTEARLCQEKPGSVSDPSGHIHVEGLTRAHARLIQKDSNYLSIYLLNNETAPEQHRDSARPETDSLDRGTDIPAKTPPDRWINREDVVTVVEDLADAGMRPGRIARTIGLYAYEVITVLRRTGR